MKKKSKHLRKLKKVNLQRRLLDLFIGTFLTLWVITCMLIALIQLGQAGLQLLGSAHKVPPQVETLILASDQWLSHYIWRTF